MKITLAPSDVAIIWEKMQGKEIETEEDQEEDPANEEILLKTNKQSH